MKDKLEKCFKGTKEIPPRIIRKKPDAGTAMAHLEKVESNILAMEKMFDEKYFDWTIVAAYYSMYHSVLAALRVIGLDARSHECAILAFEKFYTKKGKVDENYVVYLRQAKELSEKYSETLEKVKTMRVEASYGTGEIKSTDAAFAMTSAKEFASEIRKTVHEARGIGYYKMR